MAACKMPTIIRNNNSSISVSKNFKFTTIAQQWHLKLYTTFVVILIILQGCLQLELVSATSTQFRYYGQQEDMPQAEEQANVTCIPNDTQFTCDCLNVDRVST